jgi:hypothetical protein
MKFVCLITDSLSKIDQLAAEIEISGDAPEILEGVKVYMEDFIEEFSVSGKNSIQAVSSRKLELSSGEPEIEYTIYQDVRCFLQFYFFI